MKLLKVTTIAAFAIAVIGILVAPVFLHDGYSVLRNSISESAAQNVPTAWIARTALFASGVGVVAVVILKSSTWSRTTNFAFTAFGTLWIVSSLFSTKSWIVGTPFNAVENAIHSYAASGMAIVVLGAIVIGFTKQPVSLVDRLLALALASAATLFPLASVLAPEFGGLFQRVMFFYTYLWFGLQAKLA